MKAHDAASLRPKAAGVRKLIRAVIFILLLGLILGRMQYMFTRKESKKKLARFFQEQAGFDVLFTGISHMETGVSPMELYNDYGITSFNFGESGARLPFAYWTLRNALDYCTPKLVVIDVRRIDLEDKEADPYVRTNFDYFPLTKTKAEAVWDLFDGFEDRLSYLFPLIAYHDRWQELRRSDFGNIQYRIDNGTFYYGKAELAVFDPVHHSYVEPELVYKPGAVGEEYLRRMIELCQGKGIEVLLVELPFPGTRRDQRFANSVQAIADEYGVNFLNYHHIEGVVDYDTDMTNQTHVNDSGMHKTTYSIGRFITDHYDLPDRRRDSAYASWTQQYNKKFTEYKYKQLLGDRTFADTTDDAAFIWQNYYYDDDRINEYQLTLFEKVGDLYRRTREDHLQKAYDPEQVTDLLQKAGLKTEGVLDAFTLEPARPDSERITFAARETYNKEKFYG